MYAIGGAVALPCCAALCRVYRGVALFTQPYVKYTNFYFVLGKFLAFEKFFNVKSKKFALNQKARQGKAKA